MFDLVIFFGGYYAAIGFVQFDDDGLSLSEWEADGYPGYSQAVAYSCDMFRISKKLCGGGRMNKKEKEEFETKRSAVYPEESQIRKNPKCVS